MRSLGSQQGASSCWETLMDHCKIVVQHQMASRQFKNFRRHDIAVAIQQLQRSVLNRLSYANTDADTPNSAKRESIK